jgi:hypothetical protein
MNDRESLAIDPKWLADHSHLLLHDGWLRVHDFREAAQLPSLWIRGVFSGETHPAREKRNARHPRGENRQDAKDAKREFHWMGASLGVFGVLGALAISRLFGGAL